MKMIDLRSDTVTLPTEAMRKAMAAAPLGDDVFGEDPTINRLEKMSAEKIGKQSALFVPSGTMANLVSVLTWCGRGDAVVLGDQCHTFFYESASISALGSVFPQPVKNEPDGTMNLEDIRSTIRIGNIHAPRTRLICLENTHNRCYGSPLTVEYTKSVSEIAKEHNLPLHLDGARIFNAAVALGVDAAKLAENVDSVSFCFSKGLSAPVGSIICGPADFIKEARRIRKMAGGGMRQAGVLAAAGIVAMEEMIDRLADDHINARRLAEGISQIKGLSTDLSMVQTNIIYFSLDNQKISSERFVSDAAKEGILFLALGKNRFRMVTHYGIEADDIDTALAALKKVIKQVQ